MTSETKETVTVTLDREKTSLAVETLEGFALDAMSPARRKAIIDTAALLGMALDQETKEPQQTTEMFFGLATTSGPRKYKDPASVAISDDSGRMRFLPLSDNDLRRLIVDGQSYLEEKERR